MKREISSEKRIAIYNLNTGDKIKVSNGGVVEIHEVERVKRVNILTKYNGQTFNVPFSLFVEVHEKVDMKLKITERSKKIEENRKEFLKLKPGQMFWFNNKDYATILVFQEIKPGKIIGKNPVTGGRVTVDESLYGGIVDSEYINSQAQ